MASRRWFYPSIIYLMSIAIALIYIFRYPNFLSLNDLTREYTIYSALVGGGNLSSFWGVAPFGLQSSCLSTTLFPALLQKIMHIEPLLFYKLYSAFAPSFLPLVVFFIVKKFTSNFHAFLVSVFFMGQIVFLNAPSIARTNIATLFFALSLLTILTPSLSRKAKFPILFFLVIGMVVSHYSVAYISLFILGATLVIGLLWQLVRKVLLPHKSSILVVCLSLIVGLTVWYGLITQTPWHNAVDFAKNVATMNFPSPVGSESGNKITDLTNRDAITQAAFGVKNPNGNTAFSFSWEAFSINWLVIIVMSYGLLITLMRWRSEKAVPLEYLVLSIVGYAMIATVVIVPYVSRVYGIERVYFQMMVFLAIYFVFGCSDIAKRLRLKPYMVILPMLSLYFYFTYIIGMIHKV